VLCAAVSGRPLRTYTNVAVSITRRVRSRITGSAGAVIDRRPAAGACYCRTPSQASGAIS